MKTIGILLLTWTTAFCLSAEEPKHHVVPKDGFVPTEEVAIKIAVAVWTPIYGTSQIDHEKPFHAKLSGDVWTVEGSLPKNYLGGVAVAEISKTDGRILRVSHGK